ncbi:MAG: DUF1080 domain-containing protein [Planctomycetes bacterium]|nr:DUF1080 domain-containing protein [Planctomycetota bacterium]
MVRLLYSHDTDSQTMRHLSIFLNASAWMFSCYFAFCAGIVQAQDSTLATKKESLAKDGDGDETAWKSLLPADGLEGWEITNFGGEGEIANKDGELVLEPGDPLTGITRLGKDFPTENYEMQWSAQRVNGSDFFAGVTFPVGKEYCSFICGGWGGGLVGISSINGNDASENETASYRNFKNGKWYRFKVRVDPTHISVWLDDEQILQVERENRRFSVRAEVMRSRPVGYCAFQSKVIVKDWKFRTIK